MVWIVGKLFKDFQRYLERSGLSYGLFADITTAVPRGFAGPVVPSDFSDLAKLSDHLKNKPGLSVDAVITAGYENYVLPAAYIAQCFGVPGPSVDAAIAATDKSVMRRRFIQFDPALSPEFAEVSTDQDLAVFMESHRFPVMLKPTSLMKSLLITKNQSIAELRGNFQLMQEQVPKLHKQYSIARKPKCIIEEFMEGPMHTVAAFADDTGKPIIIPGIVDCVTGRQVGHDADYIFSRTLPSQLSESGQQQIYDVARKGIVALGLRSCPAHVELIMTTGGPRIIEIGARLGGYRPRMYRYGSGIDLQGLMIQNALGKSISPVVSTQRSIAVFELFPGQQGIYKEIAGFDSARQLPSYLYGSRKAYIGQTVGRADHGYKAAAVLILGNEDADQFAQDVDFVHRNVFVETDD